MQKGKRELTPILYNSAAVKLARYSRQESGSECFNYHWHDRMELLRVHTGGIALDLGGTKTQVMDHELAIIHPNQVHRGICCKAPLMYDVIMFDVRSFYNETDVCARYLPPIYEGTVRFRSITSDSDVLRCADDIFHASVNGADALSAVGYIYRLLGLFYERCFEKISPVSPFDKTIKEAIRYMEENYTFPITTDTLAAEFKYAKPYFCRKFKENTGLSPLNYLNTLRMEKALHLIKSENLDISEIAAVCGFPDANYFTRCFRKHYGNPPSFYKKAAAPVQKTAGCC